MVKYLALFASSASLTDFRLREFQCVAATLHIPIKFLDDEIPWVASGTDTFWFSVFESSASRAELKTLAERCVLLRGVYTLFETAPTLKDLYACLEERHGSAHAPVSPSMASPTTTTATAFFGEDETTHLTCSTYSYQVETIGKKYSADEKRAVTEAVLQRVPIAGEVEWRRPMRAYYIFIEHAVENAPPGAQGWVSNGPLLRVFHCCLCAESRRSALLSTYDLRRRPYIGTTSMPPEESLVMANMSSVCSGHYVYDPFCGTGSLLIAAAHYGARTFGSDADGRALRAGTEKGKTSPQMQQQRRLAIASYPEDQISSLTEEERLLPTMITNFKLYRLPLPDRARMNFSTWLQTWHAGALRGDCGGIFDSIITDPPYGLREPRKRVETTATTPSTAAEETALTKADGGNAPRRQAATVTASYPTHEVVLDLVMFAATHLVVGGHLTFWHPTTDNYTDDELPTHLSLQIVCNIEQRVSLKIVRRLIVLRKVAPVPTPPPSRESCAAKKSPDDLRLLMDVTELPGNADYTHYRAKRERKRQAAEQYKAAMNAASPHTDPCSGKGVEAGLNEGNRRHSKHGRLESQDEIVANRQRNIERRKAKQAASHLANAAHKTVDRSHP